MPIQQWSDSIWIANFSDEPGLGEDLASLFEQIQKADDPPHLVIDLSGVQNLNSSHLAQLLRIRKIMIDRDVKLRLAAPTDAIWAIFLTTALDKVFDFSGDVTTALASVQLDS